MNLSDTHIYKKPTASTIIAFRLLRDLIIMKLQTHPSPASFLLDSTNRGRKRGCKAGGRRDFLLHFFPFLFVLMHLMFFTLIVTVVSNRSPCFHVACFPTLKNLSHQASSEITIPALELHPPHRFENQLQGTLFKILKQCLVPRGLKPKSMETLT